MNCVYLITFPERKRLGINPHSYIGSKSNCSFIDGVLYNSRGRPYWGSSADAGMVDLLKTDEPKIVELLGQFEIYGDCIAYERQLHIEYDVVASIEYFNRSYAGSSVYSDPNYRTVRHSLTGEYVRLEKDHPSIADGTYVNANEGMKNYNNGLENRQFLYPPDDSWVAGRLTYPDNSGESNPFFGKTHSAETKLKMSISAKALVTDETRMVASIRAKQTFTGVPKTDEHKQKISAASKGRVTLQNSLTGETICVSIDDPRNGSEPWVSPYAYHRKHADDKDLVTCEYCGYESDTSNAAFYKHHSDRCKKNPNSPEPIIIQCPDCGKSGEEGNFGFVANHFGRCIDRQWEPWNSGKNKQNPDLMFFYSKLDELYQIFIPVMHDVKDWSKKRVFLFAKAGFRYQVAPHNLRNALHKIIDDGFTPIENQSWLNFKETYDACN